jgi:hypothetical protein
VLIFSFLGSLLEEARVTLGAVLWPEESLFFGHSQEREVLRGVHPEAHGDRRFFNRLLEILIGLPEDVPI